MVLAYLRCFVVGGIICMLGQILIIKTTITSSRILVLFVCIGAILEGFDLYDSLINFAGAGATVPITGFGRSLAKGVIDAVKEKGVLGIFTGGLTATAGGIAAAVIFAFIRFVIGKRKFGFCRAVMNAGDRLDDIQINLLGILYLRNGTDCNFPLIVF